MSPITYSTSPTTLSARAATSRTWSYAATTSISWMPLAPAASPTRPLPVTSAAASPRPISTPCKRLSTRFANASGSMDIAYDGTWGYHPLVLSLANTGEVLSLVNRPGNRPSHEGAAAQVDRALEVCFRGGFRRVLLRGDSDFSQAEHLHRWNADARVRFLV